MTYIRCPHCGAKALNVATMCPQCRTPLSQNPMEAGPHGLAACPRCGKFIERDADVCAYCGHHVRRSRLVRRWVGAAVAGVVLVTSAAYGLRTIGGPAAVLAWFRAQKVSPAAEPPSPEVPADTVSPAVAAPTPGIAPPVPPDTARAGPPGLSVRYARTWANVRVGRATDADIVAILRPGTRVAVADFASGWWAVWRDGTLLGYVATDLLSAEPVVDSLP